MSNRIELVQIKMTPKLSFPHKDINFPSPMIQSSSIIGIEKVENLFLITIDKESVRYNLDILCFDNFEHLIFYTHEYESFTKRFYTSLLEKLEP